VSGDVVQFHEKGRLGFLKKLDSSKVIGTPGILDFVQIPDSSTFLGILGILRNVWISWFFSKNVRDLNRWEWFRMLRNA